MPCGELVDTAIVIQLLDVIAGAVMRVMTAMTKGTGQLNLAQGMFGTTKGGGAALSRTLSGLDRRGF